MVSLPIKINAKDDSYKDITDPHAAVIVWNYDERITSKKSKKPHAISERVIISGSLISVRTNKTKSQPAGSFELQIAPTFNWLSRLTPGSWLVVLMARSSSLNEKIIDGATADGRYVKMLGRISSCRLSVSVDPLTGSRQSYYIVTGQDWGSVFNTNIYIDETYQRAILDGTDSIGQSLTVGYASKVTDMLEKGKIPLSSSEWTNLVIKLWGYTLTELKSKLDSIVPSQVEQTLGTSEKQFQLPAEVAKFFNQGTLLPAKNFADIIQTKTGILLDYDLYQDAEDGKGIIPPDKLLGTYNFWQLLTLASNPAVNELFTDLHWSDDDTPEFSLYKRVRPFINNTNFDGSSDPVVSDLISKFKNVKRHNIRLNDVLAVNAGTNFADKINFIEVRPALTLIDVDVDTETFIKRQSIDKLAVERDGFLPYITYINFLRYDSSGPRINESVGIKHLFREWYFNTHLMLNGSLTIVGIDDYIAVGDNFIVDAKVLGLNHNMSKSQKEVAPTYLLGHIESVSHTFVINSESGARSYATVINFVRGIISDENGNILDDMYAAIDDSANSLTTVDEKNIVNIIPSSTPADPDKDKFKGI